MLHFLQLQVLSAGTATCVAIYHNYLKVELSTSENHNLISLFSYSEVFDSFQSSFLILSSVCIGQCFRIFWVKVFK